MDDLIKRLRDAAIFGPIPCPVCDESADAIERLIKEHGAFQDQCISLKMRMTIMREERDMLVDALKALYDYAPTTLTCDDFHHLKKHRHGADETCPVTARYYHGLSAAEAALAAVEKTK